MCLEEDDPVDPATMYECAPCKFEVCSLCFKGHLHPFHMHRLRQAQPSLAYPGTGGQWRCDACHSLFTDVTQSSVAYHCAECEVDLCTDCFTGSLTHTLHAKHTLTPVDPRLIYRTHLSWTCDNCSDTFSATSCELFFHCSQCQFDLCVKCYHGDKHHQHEHELVATHLAQHNTCSNCQRQPSSYQCIDESCPYALCHLCHTIETKPHPLHPHKLELCDARLVYPQSAGLWHCDNCTHRRGQEIPRPPSEAMYHCHDCDFDLCEQCYLTGLAPTPAHRPHPPHYESPSYSQQLLTVLAPPTHTSHTLCLQCGLHPASLVFVHGFQRCTEQPIVCQSCSSDILTYRKPCPYCRAIPNHVEDPRF